jgi:hypothetical protein
MGTDVYKKRIDGYVFTESELRAMLLKGLLESKSPGGQERIKELNKKHIRKKESKDG